MRVLHLFDHTTISLPYARLALLAQALGRLPGVEQDVCLLGNRNLERAVESLGIPVRCRISPPGRHAAFAVFTARKRLQARSYDLIHCWSAQSLGSATLAMLLAPSVPRVVTVSELPTARQSHWARFLSGERNTRTTYLPISNTIRRELLTHGVSESAVHVLRPGIDMGLVDRSQREALREEWGIAPNTTVVGLLGDPIEDVNGLHAYMTIGLANEAMRTENRQLALVVHSHQVERLQATTVSRHLNQFEMIIVDDRIACPWKTLPACDIAMTIGPQAGHLSLLWAMAAGVPIAGDASYAVSEIVEDHHSALLARPGVPKALSHRVTQLVEDQQLAWKLKDTARHEAYSLFSRQRYVQSLGQVYQQVVQKKAVTIEELPVTGGMKFAARA